VNRKDSKIHCDPDKKAYAVTIEDVVLTEAENKEEAKDNISSWIATNINDLDLKATEIDNEDI
jgi:hypothetical protein